MQEISWLVPQFMRRDRTSWQYNRAVKSKENKIILCFFYFSLGKARLQQVLTTLLVQAQVFALINK